MAKRGRPRKVSRFDGPSASTISPEDDSAGFALQPQDPAEDGDGAEARPVSGSHWRAMKRQRDADARAQSAVLVDVLYASISQVLVQVLRRMGFSARVSAAVALSPADLETLRNPTVDMLQKYLPMAAYGTEWAFALALLGVGASKWMTIQMAIAAEQEQQPPQAA